MIILLDAMIMIETGQDILYKDEALQASTISFWLCAIYTDVGGFYSH